MRACSNDVVLESECSGQSSIYPAKRWVTLNVDNIKVIMFIGACIIYTTNCGKNPSSSRIDRTQDLASQIGILAQEIDESDSIRKRISDDEIELAWKEQHIDELEGEVDKMHNIFETVNKVKKDLSDELSNTFTKYEVEREENIALRQMLARKVEELRTAELLFARNTLRGPKHLKYRSGDWVNFSERSPSGELYYLYPGIVTTIFCDTEKSTCLYDIVMISRGVMKKDVTIKEMTPYSPYSVGDTGICHSGPCIVKGFHGNPANIMDFKYLVQYTGTLEKELVAAKSVYREVRKSAH